MSIVHESWRNNKPHKPDFIGKTPEPYPATRFFDQLCFIGDEGVCCFLLETREGLVLLDCMNPDSRCINIIENGIKDMGHDPSELIAILITHGHGDHWGEAGYFKKKYGCKVYMSEIDYKGFAVCVPPRFPWKSLDYEMDGYLTDMGQYTFGDTTITVVHTPGHTKGCMSFIIPVTDEGRAHTVALWGGTGILPSSDPDEYMASCLRFGTICDAYYVDGEIATHPFVDCSIRRLDIINNITDGVPNPFVIGKEGFRYYHNMFYNIAANAKKQREARRDVNKNLG